MSAPKVACNGAASRFRAELGRLLLGLGLCLAAMWLFSWADARGQTPEAAAPARAEIAPGQGPVSYELRAVLDTTEHRIAGSGVIHWINASRVAQREVWLHLYLNAFKNERTVFMRSPAGGGFRGSGRPGRWGYLTVERLYAREQQKDLWPGADKTSPGEPDDETDVRVPLAGEVAPGGALTFEIAFTAELPAIVLRTGYSGSFHLCGQWFPKLARLDPDGAWRHFPFHRLSEFDADFGDYDVTIDTPARFTVGATGVPSGGATDSGDRRQQRYLATRVLDFAFSAWDGFAEVRQMAGPVQLVALFPRGQEAAADRELETVEAGLAYFGERYGPYPYRRLTIVRPPADAVEAGGMEYPMLITTGASERLRFLGVRSIEFLTVHELAHQWFYGLLASDEYRNPLLDEGLASYAELDAMESRWPGASGADALGWQISGPAAARAFAATVAEHGPIVRSASEFASGGDYAGLVYARTATVLMTLGRVFGEDRLRAALARYTREQRFAHPEPPALYSAVRAEMGDEPAALLAAALEGGAIDYSVVGFSSWKEDEPQGIFGDPKAPSKPVGDGRWHGFVTVRRRGALAIPIDVEVWSTSGARTMLHWDGKGRASGDHAVLAWQGDGAIVAVLIDPEGRVLLDGDLANNAMRESRRRIAPRVLAIGAWLAQAAMGVVLP